MNKPITNDRRQVAFVSVLGTTQLHLRNPFIIALWSTAFPGMGHLLLSKYLRGFVLFIWEVIVNALAHVNLALLYSFTGRFEMAKDVLDVNWLLLYFPTYFFAIWDSYRTAIDLNHTYILATREDAVIKPYIISALEINYLDKRSPWVSLMWSYLMPGAGQLYIHRLATALFLLIWWIVIMYQSKFLPAIHFTLLGDFAKATSVIDVHWFLNIPSVYFFAIYDAYTNTVENNKLYDWEQSKFLKRNYQPNTYQLPFPETKARENRMYIVSTFEHNKYLEMAITGIQMLGVPKENILAVPMDKRGEDRKLFDSIHQSDGLSLLDLPLILATMLCIFGAIYGFILPWGPVIWGLIGMLLGFVIGLGVKMLFTLKFTKSRSKRVKLSEVVVIVSCKDDQIEMVRQEFWKNHALGVRKLDLEGKV